MTQPTYSASLLDPSGSHPLLAAVQWLEGTLLGTVATMVAVICVAVAGFMMLSGRIDVRYGVSVVLGCFILFGASSIVGGIQSAAAQFGGISGGYEAPPPVVTVEQSPLPVISAGPARPEPSRADPYAGAAVPPPR
jgi:type IV secretory pathway VirB2 component (pilin)